MILLFIIFLFCVLGWIFERKMNPEVFRPSTKGLWDGICWFAVTLMTVGMVIGAGTQIRQYNRIVIDVW